MLPKKISYTIIPVFVALCLATNYALAGVPNVKLMDFLVFIGGFFFGSFAGASIGIFTWIVYGTINPYGGFSLPVWLACILSEAVYGVVGGVLGKKFFSTSFDERLMLSVFFGIIGFILTLIYDLVTTAAFSWSFNIPIIAAVIFGMPFYILHEISNAALFAVCSIPTISGLKKIF